MIYKFYWGFKSIFYSILFKKFQFPSYIGGFIFHAGLKNVEVNKRVRIYPGLRIETYESGKIIFEENVSIGQNFHITSARSTLIIGKNTTILGNTFVTNIDHEYKNIDHHVMDQPMIVSETKIGENCYIGYGVAIQAGTVLGKQCIIGTNSVVKGIFPDYCVIVGAPAKIVKKYNFETNVWEKIS